MKLLQPPTSLRQTLQYIEWTLIIVELLVAGITRSYRSVEATAGIFAFHAIFLFLSLIIPLERPLWQRRGYVLLNMSMLSFSLLAGWRFDLILCWSIAKSCFLLSRQEVVLTIVLNGVPYFLALVWRVSYWTNETTALIAQKGITRVLEENKSVILLSQLGFYFAGSIFSVLFSYLVIAERQSRGKAEALTQQVETLAVALERTRIARDIHDSLGHTLTTLSIQLEFAQKLRSNSDLAFAAIDTASLLANQCLTDVRRALQTMHQPDFDLHQALYALVEQVKFNQVFTVKFEVKLPPLPLQTSHQLYCVLQEGLTNIQKHASKATCVSLSGWHTPDYIVLELTDNGQGFERSLSHSGFGLRGMQERVQLLGGQIQIQSTPGHGTQIHVTIPHK